MSKFVINGGKKLAGEIKVNSSKNATVALVMASLINKGTTTLKNVPEIEEVSRMLEVIRSIGVKIKREERKLIITPPKKFNIKNIDTEAAKKTRGIILGIGALAGQVGRFEIPQAGGCRLGSRTVKPHLFALENFGINIKTTEDSYIVSAPKLKRAELILYETGDTVTENALIAAAQVNGRSEIRMASSNYMVQDLGFFLEKLGVKVTWTGSGIVEVTGKKNINKDVSYEISEDPIEAMFFLCLAITTDSNIKIKRCPIDFLELELLKLEKMGLKYKMSKKYKSNNNRTDLVDIEVLPSKLVALEEKIHAMPYPGINQDNLPFFVPIATKAEGRTLIHDWTYENRAIYFSLLNKLGAKVNLIDPHRVEVEGSSKLTGAEVVCPPALRPAAIILGAMLGAKGKSVLHNVYPIARGYERIEERLRRLGAEIERTE
ncbi:UDP-N-acetylglucosamine 1-carboxyvinyltransferase [Candidatus Falkowbacteria bacterium]|nr:UDP-N-acetylglucosamine 1-carboxyvinyltransferase [Candidatus Falkowbacteria bacterium]